MGGVRRRMTQSHGGARQVKKSHVRCLHKAAAVRGGAEALTKACQPADETPPASRGLLLEEGGTDGKPVRRPLQDWCPLVSRYLLGIF